LSLFETEVPATVSPEAEALRGLSRRERLAALLKGGLDFRGENTGYASHGLHAFPAKFPPQLPRAFIRALSEPGNVVLDPMMGSGTTLVEALIEGRNAVGVDIDPLAIRLSGTKTTVLDTSKVRRTGARVVTVASALLEKGDVLDHALAEAFDEPTKQFVNYWFQPDTQRELMALSLAIREVKEASVRRFLELTFSSVIITKSGGVSKARDLAHSRPHLDKQKKPKGALEQFSVRLLRNAASLSQLDANGCSALVLAGDARTLPLASSSVDLVVTSPPYANAIDYMRAHKFSLVWFGRNVTDLSQKRARYIGSERVASAETVALPSEVEDTIAKLAEPDQRKSAVLRKYFHEMKDVLQEIHRVLRPDSAAIIVVGTSVMRGINVETHAHLARIAEGAGFDLVGIAQRAIDRNRRMMPARFGNKSASMIEQRMHEEYVIGLLKRG
jgi:DNA modification methylase